MKQGTFEKEIFILSDTASVIDLIADYSLHHKIHPLIENVEHDKEEPASVRRYFITENLQWGPFTFKIKYRADILSVTQDTVHTETYQSPGTYINNTARVTPEKDGVTLHETIKMTAPDILFNYAFLQAQTACEETLKRIKTLMENSR